MSIALRVVFFVAIIAVVMCKDCEFHGTTFAAGETGQPKGECMKVTCTPEGFAAALPCGLVAPPQGCKKVKFEQADTSKPYPDCCPKPSCETEADDKH